MDGREVCRLMRRGGVKSPIIMLTAAESDADTILALDAGANDYATKPFRLGVLLARMRAQLRHHAQSEDAVSNIGPYTFPPSANQIGRASRRERACQDVSIPVVAVSLKKQKDQTLTSI